MLEPAVLPVLFCPELLQKYVSDNGIAFLLESTYLVLGGMRMLFRVQVLGFLPASASTAAKLGSLGGDELA